MQSVFLGEPGPINRVYTEKQKEFLRNEANLNTDAIISKDNIAEHLNLTRNADYAFSTWGIPKFTQEEIINYFPRLKAVFYAAGSVAYFAREYLENDI